VVYAETFQEQAARTDRTWERYTRFELSPVVGEYMARFQAMRAKEVTEARRRLGG
jgi:nicotinate phosphoribosyltransferase